MNWPIGEFDDLRRLRALATTIPGTVLVETILPASFDDVWAVLGDPERGFPGLVPDVRSLHVTERDNERLRVMVYGHSGLRAPFDMILRPGWCLMQSRLVVFGMAAVPAGPDTRFGYLAGLRPPGLRIIGPLLAPANPAVRPCRPAPLQHPVHPRQLTCRPERRNSRPAWSTSRDCSALTHPLPSMNTY